MSGPSIYLDPYEDSADSAQQAAMYAQETYLSILDEEDQAFLVMRAGNFAVYAATWKDVEAPCPSYSEMLLGAAKAAYDEEQWQVETLMAALGISE